MNSPEIFKVKSTSGAQDMVLAPQDEHQITYSQEENLQTETFDGQTDAIFINDQNPQSSIYNESNLKKNIIHIIHTDQSEKKLINYQNETNGDLQKKRSKKKTKSMLNSFNVQPSQVSKSQDKKAKVVPEIDVKTLAKKYKILKKSGEYQGGLSTDARNVRQSTAKGISNAQGGNKTTKASGKVDRFGNENTN